MCSRKTWTLGALLAIAVGIATALDVSSRSQGGLVDGLFAFALSVSPVAIETNGAQTRVTLKL